MNTICKMFACAMVLLLLVIVSPAHSQILRDKQLEETLKKRKMFKSYLYMLARPEDFKKGREATIAAFRKSVDGVNTDSGTAVAPGKFSFGNLRMAAETKRLDVACILIASLKFQGRVNPVADEWRPKELIDVIVDILNYYYGNDCCPLLIHHGITTKNKYVQQRCAYAVRIIASPKQLKEYLRVYSFLDATDENTIRFGKLLTQKKINIQIPAADSFPPPLTKEKK